MDINKEIENARALHKAGKFSKASELYKKLSKAEPKNSRILYLQGMLAIQKNQISLAEKFLKKALTFADADGKIEILNGLGQALYFKGDKSGSANYWKQAYVLDPQITTTAYNLGTLELEKSNWEVAKQYFEEAKENGLNDTSLNMNLARAHLGIKSYSTAVSIYQEMTHNSPNQFEIWCSLAHALNKNGEPEAAIKAFRKAETLNRNFAPAYLNLANSRMLLADLSGAIAALDQALALDTDFEEAYHKKLFFSHYQPSSDAKSLYKLHSEWGRRFSRRLHIKIQTPLKKVAKKKEHLSIGYVSPDLRGHSVGVFMKPLVAAHDRSQFRITCYSGTNSPDDITLDIKNNTDQWRETAFLSDDELSNKIRQDNIDILVDLSGHTNGNRLGVFARKPAPVQITYLGYPGTVGLPEIEFRIADECSEPPSNQPYSTEKLIRLPSGFHCFIGPGFDVPLTSAPFEKNGYITFGSFNNIAKINEDVISVWAEILSKLPDAKLILKNRCFHLQTVCDKFLGSFIKYGAKAQQISLKPMTKTRREHLLQYADLDIALDPFPYNGTTTTCEALWMGVPVVGLLEEDKGICYHHSRVGLSLLAQIGLQEELLAHSKSSYVSIATELSKQHRLLQKFRRNMRKNIQSSSLGKIGSFAYELEEAYRQAWNKSDYTLT